MPKFIRLLHCSLNLRKLFIHHVNLKKNICTYLPIRNRLATGSVLAIVFGVLLAFSLIAIGYLLFSHRRSKPPKIKESETVVPFQNVEYDYLGPTTTSQGLLQRTPHTSMQSSNLGMRVADTKTINSEVVTVNVGHPLVAKVL